MKLGLDDFFAAGGTVEELIANAKSELPPKPEAEFVPVIRNEYRDTPEGLVRVDLDDEGFERLILLANFSAAITTTVVEDDGLTKVQHLVVGVRRGEMVRTVEVPAEDFGAMFWVTEKLDPSFVITAGFGPRDHARAAIQELSGEPATRTVYLHSGWRAFGAGRADWAYLHGGGAIGARGEMPGIDVRLPENLSSFKLPPPPDGDVLRGAVRAALGFLKVAADRVTFVLFALMARALLGRSDVSGHLSGPTGSFKTEVAALIQQFFGAQFGARSLPGSWSSTGNALEALAFAMKDAIFVVDDFVPQGGAHDAARLHREADRLLRAQGNNSGRQRMNADSTLRVTRFPRGIILSTGEDTPAGQSLRARLCIVELSRGDVDTAELTRCQDDARAGRYAQATAAFVRWLAARREGLEERVRARVQELRALIFERSTAEHRRTVDVIGNLYAGFETYCEFALEVGAIDAAAQAALLKRTWTALLAAADEQNAAQASFDPVEQFVSLLRSAVSSGAAHLADAKGEPPKGYEHEAVGWQRTFDGASATTWQARGKRIGWLIDEELYLDPTTSFSAAQSMTDDVNRISIIPRTLAKRLHERGYLASTEEERGKHTVRKTIQGSRHDLLHLKRALLVGEALQAHQAHTPSQDTGKADFDAQATSGPGPQPESQRPTGDGDGPIGPEGPLSGDSANSNWGEA